MQKIVEGRRYNTETAEAVASGGNSLSRSDFRHYSETLYRTKGGNWFLCGHGGPLTRYKERCGDGWTSGEKLIPIDASEARDWLEEHDEIPALEEYFSDSIEDA